MVIRNREDTPFSDIPLSKQVAATEVSFQEQTNLLLQILKRLLLSFFDNNGVNRSLLDATPIAKQYTTSEDHRTDQRRIWLYTGTQTADRDMPGILLDVGSYKPKKDLGINCEQPGDMIKKNMFLQRFISIMSVLIKVASHSEQTTNNLNFLIAQILTIHIPFKYHGIIANDTANYQIIFPMQVEPSGEHDRTEERDAIREKLFSYLFQFDVTFESIIYRTFPQTPIRDIFLEANIGTPSLFQPEIIAPDVVQLGQTVDIVIKTISANPSVFSTDSAILKIIKVGSQTFYGRAIRPGNTKLILQDGDNRIEKTVVVTF